jgi:putative ABC transport system substrate-binding protein
MRRREFITLFGTAAAWPIAARAQQDARERRIGVLMADGEADPEGQARFVALRQRLVDLGWIEGRNLRLEVRWAGPDAAPQQNHARELVALAPDVIVGATQTTMLALRGATQTIPLVFVGLSDPVATGIVSNLARPEANVTGFMRFEHSMAGKWLSLIKDVAPRLARVALLFNPDTAPFASLYTRAAQEAGERLALKVTPAPVRDVAAIGPAVAAMAVPNDGGLLILPQPFNTSNRATTIALATQYQVPAIYYDRHYPEDGGLMSYGADLKLQYRDGATYVDRILRGAKVSELPVQFATKFELVVNLKTAKAIGLTIPESFLLRTDEVIE